MCLRKIKLNQLSKKLTEQPLENVECDHNSSSKQNSIHKCKNQHAYMIRFNSDVGHRFFFLTKLSLYALRGSSTIFSCMQNINSDFFKLYITKKRFFSFRPLSLVNKILQLHQINVGFLWSQQDERQKFLYVKKQIKQDANNQNKNKNKMPFFS